MQDTIADKGLKLSQSALFQLQGVAKWARVSSIIGFVLVGIMILVGFGTGFFVELRPEEQIPPKLAIIVFPVIYTVTATICFFPVLWLYKFSTYAKQSLTQSDPQQLSIAFSHLGNHYRYISILAIVWLSLFVLGVSMVLVSLAVK